MPSPRKYASAFKGRDEGVRLNCLHDPSEWKKFNNWLNSQFGDEAHLVAAVLVGVEELEELGTLEGVHDLDLPLDVAPVLPRGALHELGREGVARGEVHAFQHLSELSSGRQK